MQPPAFPTHKLNAADLLAFPYIGTTSFSPYVLSSSCWRPYGNILPPPHYPTPSRPQTNILYSMPSSYGYFSNISHLQPPWTSSARAAAAAMRSTPVATTSTAENGARDVAPPTAIVTLPAMAMHKNYQNYQASRDQRPQQLRPHRLQP